MESLTHWDLDTAESREDEAQLKRDMRYHPRTSGKSLRELARMCATQGSLHANRQLDTAYAWLSEFRDKLPREIEDENGNRNSDQRLERLVDEYDQLLVTLESDLDVSSGLYDVTTRTCYISLEAVAARHSEDAKLLGDFGMIVPVYCYLMEIRGAMLQDYLYAEERRRVLERNPERYGMDAIMSRDLKRKVVKSNAKPVPDCVADMLTYSDGVLRWAIDSGASAVGSVAEGKHVQVKGCRVRRNRIIYRLVHGVDAGDLNVSDDGLSASPYRDNVKVGIHKRDDGTFDVVVDLPHTHTLAVCSDMGVAEGVRRGILWTINHL